MFTVKKVWVVIFIGVLHVMTNDVFAYSTLDKSVAEKVSKAVFEVVIPKPTADSLSYATPLPVHLIPYTIREDKYYSIGTAFAIGQNRFASAAHVMNLGVESQFKEVCLRDKDGKVYNIDKITNYSERRDFIVFSLKDKVVKDFFQLNPSPKVTEQVFAVGNALGDGIVIRDGLYTSDTPEDEKGEWKWIRFSAAASPGNSGGPLLDVKGNVIGIVLQKSPNENLNIALPVSELINSKSDTAVAHKPMRFTIDNIRTATFPVFHKEIKLPKTYRELNDELVEGLKLSHYNAAHDFFITGKESIFPRGKGSDNVLHSNFDMVFPNLIYQFDAGTWSAAYPKEIKQNELANNGKVRYGNMENTVFMHIEKPDDVDLKRFYTDSKLFMDTILKGFYFSRQVGNEPVRITSLGKSSESYIHIDSYGRKWMVKTWLLEYSDQKVVTFSLPVPGGCIVMMRYGQTGFVDISDTADLKIYSNFISLCYYGTLKQWKEFLDVKDALPALFKDISILSEYGKKLDYHSKRLKFSIQADFMNVSGDSVVKIAFSYYRQDGAIVWDVGSIVYVEDKNKETHITIERKSKPADDLGDKFKSDWADAVNRRFPYNRSPYQENKLTRILTTIDGQREQSSICYAISYNKEGKVEQGIMDLGLDMLVKNLVVYEYHDSVSEMASTSTQAGYHNAGEYFRALYNDKYILNMKPRSDDGYLLRGNLYRDKGDYKQALINYDKAVLLNPENALAYFLRGIVHRDNNDAGLAISDFTMAVKVKPDYSDAYYNRGYMYGKTDQAITDYTKAIELDEKYVDAYIQRGLAFERKGNVDLAMEDYSKAINMNIGNYYIALVNRGNIYRDKLDYDNAINDYNKALEHNPQYAPAFDNRGITWGRKGEYDKAISDFNNALGIDPKKALTYNNRGFTYKLKGEFNKAIADFDRAIEIDSMNHTAYINRGNTYAIKRDKYNACADWQKACEHGACENYNRARKAGHCK